MNSKTLTIAAILAAALLAGIFSATTPMAVYAEDDYDDDEHDDDERDNDERDNDKDGDYSGTNTEQKLKQTNDGSGASTNFNCGENSIKGGFIDAQLCGQASIDLDRRGIPFLTE